MKTKNNLFYLTLLLTFIFFSVSSYSQKKSDKPEKEKKEIATLPRNLLEAVDSFSKDKLIHEVFSKPLINNFVSYKYDEWRRYHTTTTDWEIKEYLKLF